MSETIETYYDGFSSRFLKDFMHGNLRVTRQMDFIKEALVPGTNRVLIIGCGSGEGAYNVAKKISKSATILAVDISGKNISMAEALFSHPRIRYLHADVVDEELEGKWEAIILPDVYEHIPVSSRDPLHKKLNGWLEENGRILITVPSPAYQRSLLARGECMQVVDETVTLEDLAAMAEDVGGSLTYFNQISVWKTNDYIHAVIERDANHVRLLNSADQAIAIKRHKKVPDPGSGIALAAKVMNRIGFLWRKAILLHKLRKAGIQGEWSNIDV